MSMGRIKRDLYLGIGFLLFSIGVWIASFSIRHLVVARIGSAFVPRLAATLLGGLSVLLIIQSLSGKRGDKAPEQASTSPSASSSEVAAAKRGRRVELTFLLILAYLALLEPVGFLITTALYLFFQFWVLSREPNLPLYGIIAVSTSVIIYYLFVYVFILFLPAGVLG